MWEEGGLLRRVVATAVRDAELGVWPSDGRILLGKTRIARAGADLTPVPTGSMRTGRIHRVEMKLWPSSNRGRWG